MNKYDDIISLPYPPLGMKHNISVSDRAAQFAPFAALTGHDAAIQETARFTDRKITLDEYEKAQLDTRLKVIENINAPIMVEITYFRPDERKAGGEYVTVTGQILKIDPTCKKIIMQDEREIAIDDILSIRGSLFEEYE